jgi:hypothetical protein
MCPAAAAFADRRRRRPAGQRNVKSGLTDGGRISIRPPSMA